jgi:hypothetical protein
MLLPFVQNFIVQNADIRFHTIESNDSCPCDSKGGAMNEKMTFLSLCNSVLVLERPAEKLKFL